MMNKGSNPAIPVPFAQPAPPPEQSQQLPYPPQQLPYPPPPPIRPPSITEMAQADVQRRIRAEEREKADRRALMFEAAKIIVSAAKGPPPQMAFLGFDLIADICREWLAVERKKESKAATDSEPSARCFEQDMAKLVQFVVTEATYGRDATLVVGAIYRVLGVDPDKLYISEHDAIRCGDDYAVFLRNSLPDWVTGKLGMRLPNAAPAS